MPLSVPRLGVLSARRLLQLLQRGPQWAKHVLLLLLLLLLLVQAAGGLSGHQVAALLAGHISR